MWRVSFEYLTPAGRWKHAQREAYDRVSVLGQLRRLRRLEAHGEARSIRLEVQQPAQWRDVTAEVEAELSEGDDDGTRSPDG